VRVPLRQAETELNQTHRLLLSLFYLLRLAGFTSQPHLYGPWTAHWENLEDFLSGNFSACHVILRCGISDYCEERALSSMTTVYTPGAQIDHYEVIRMLGHGGMSRVYLAHDLHTQRKVVLKFPNDDIIGDVAVFERYRREAEIGSRLNHPHIQHLLNVDEQRSDQYLVVEYIEGQTLRKLLEEREGEPLSPDEALRITMQVCDALAYCHEHGVYHRDIKPENIMLQPDGNVKIIDFGVALLEGARRVTWRGLSGTVGTPDYMSPEQLRGERGTASSDIYAAGMMLYEMLCGHTPFDGENVFAIMNQHVSHDPPSILQYKPDLSPALATVVMHAIRRDPEKRYKSVRDLLTDLSHLEEVRPEPYQPDEPSLNRNGRTALTATLIIIAILLAIIAFGILAQNLHGR
jgi:serine/threonine protein kinase